MATRETAVPRAAPRAPGWSDPAYQLSRALHIDFIVAPILASLDKFFHGLVDWTTYLWPPAADMLGLSPGAFMGSGWWRSSRGWWWR